MDTEAEVDRARGAFVGLAVGDALGTTLEFTWRDTQPLHTEMIGGGPFGLPPGCFTDDASMALCLADSLIARRTLDERDVMDRFTGWLERGENSPQGRCFDIGNTTRDALIRYARTGEPIAGDIDPMSAGNGSLMRLAPVPIAFRKDPAVARDMARRSSATTHGAVECLEACAFFSDLLIEAMAGAGRQEVLGPRPWRGDTRVPEITNGGWRGKSRSEISSSGYVIDTLEAALWCVGETESFDAALILAVNLARDADTVGAVTGQLAGALYGLGGIPRRWVDTLMWRDRFIERADALIALA